jgi:DNA-binding response OmpR family regulator
MKQNQTYKDIFFLFLSSKEESPRLIHQGFDAGADDFFTRPLRVEVILAKVKRLSPASGKRRSRKPRLRRPPWSAP